MPPVIGRASLRSASNLDSTMENFALNFLEALNDDSIAKKLREVLFGGFKEMCESMGQNIVSSLRAEIRQRDEQIDNLKSEIKFLKNKTDDMEQWTRRGSMRIQGIPESTPGSLDDKLLDLFNTRLKITPPIAKEEIEVAHRLPRGMFRPRNNSDAAATENQRENATQPPPTVIIKFVSRRTKEVVMGKKTKLKDIKEDNELPIYFQDDLTATRAKLSYKARQLKHQNKIIDTWVINSKVMIKDRRNRIHNVKCQDDLDMFGNWKLLQGIKSD